MLLGLGEPAGKRLRAVEGEHPPGSRFGIEPVRESGLDVRRFVREGEWFEAAGNLVRKAGHVLRGLLFHARQRGPLGLRLDAPNSLPIDEQEVIGPAVSLPHRELADRDPLTSPQVRIVAVLHDPARSLELPIDLDSGPGLCREIVVPSGSLIRQWSALHTSPPAHRRKRRIRVQRSESGGVFATASA